MPKRVCLAACSHPNIDVHLRVLFCCCTYNRHTPTLTHSARPVDGVSGSFAWQGRPIRKVEVCGVVTEVDTKAVKGYTLMKYRK